MVSIAVIVIVAMATRRHPNTRPMHPPAEETGGIFNNYLPAMYPCWSLCLCILVFPQIYLCLIIAGLYVYVSQLHV